MTDYEKLLNAFALFSRDLSLASSETGEKRIALYNNCVIFEFSLDDKLKAYRVGNIYRQGEEVKDTENWRP